MIKLRQALLFCALLTACAAEERAEDDTIIGSELVAPRKDDTDRRPAGHPAGDPKNGEKTPGQRRPAPRSCDDLQHSARTLLGSFQACTKDSDCIVDHVDAPCLATFLCQVSVSRDSDLQTLAHAARSLSLTYRHACGDHCPVARCISPESLHTFCDQETKRCSSEMRTTPEADAGATPVPAADAGA